jgi:hypothetical protein
MRRDAPAARRRAEIIAVGCWLSAVGGHPEP